MSELRCCSIVKNGQDARSTKNEFSCGTGILPVPKQVIENGAISHSEGKKSEGRSPMEVGRRKEKTIPNAQFPRPNLYQIRLHRNDINGGDGGDGSAVSLPRSIVGTRHCRLLYIIPAQPELILPKKVDTSDPTVKLFLAKINQKKAALLSW